MARHRSTRSPRTDTRVSGLFIQLLTTVWTRVSRGGAGPRVRDTTPLASELPEATSPISATTLLTSSAAPPPSLSGRKDVVLVAPGQTLKFSGGAQSNQIDPKVKTSTAIQKPGNPSMKPRRKT